MYGFTYITTNLINSMKYIGRRKYDKQGQWRTYLGSGWAFKKAVKKYGRENFRREIIEWYETPEELNVAEEKLIKDLDAVNNREYYNLSAGGNVEHGFHKSEELKRKVGKKISAAFTDERRKAYSERMKLNNPNADGHISRGRKYSDEVRKQMSERAKGHPGLKGKDNLNYGKKGELSPVYGDKSPNARAVRCTETGQVFKTLREAGEFCGTSGSQVSLACKGINETCMGYHWEYYGETKKELKRTKESKEKISKAKIGNKNPMAKPVLCIETNTIYGAAYEAGRAYNIRGEAITNCCKGRSHTAAKMHWRYLKDEEYEGYNQD